MQWNSTAIYGQINDAQAYNFHNFSVFSIHHRPQIEEQTLMPWKVQVLLENHLVETALNTYVILMQFGLIVQTRR